MELTKFNEIVDEYRVIFFDAFGVLKNSQGLIPGIEKTFHHLMEKKTEFYIVTNDASRSPERLAHSYNSAGLQMITPRKIISSGMIAREFLRHKVPGGIVAYLGTSQSEHYLEDLGLTTVPVKHLDMERLNEVNAMVLLDDDGFDWNHDINKAINVLRKEPMPVILANSDLAYPVSGNEVSVAIGGIAAMMQAVTGQEFMRFGKPDGEMFHYAYDHVIQQHSLPKSQILMVGDTLSTDIIGGNKFGIDTALVLTGNTHPKNADLKIRSTGIIPTYICEDAVV